MTLRWCVWWLDSNRPRRLGEVEAATAFGALQRAKLQLDVPLRQDAYVFVTPVCSGRWSELSVMP